MYLLAVTGSQALGSTLWGMVGSHYGVPLALTAAAITMLVTAARITMLPLPSSSNLWSDPGANSGDNQAPAGSRPTRTRSSTRSP
jgi:hypothetical protein